MSVRALAERLHLTPSPDDLQATGQGGGARFHATLGPFMVLLRLAMAWVFLWASFGKLLS